MKKTLVMFLVASLLLAGCTELTSDDGETIVEVNEEVALEKILDIVNPSDDSSWGMTYIMEMDMDNMMGMSDSMDSEDDESVETKMTMQMTQAMSPNGVHVASVTTMLSEDTQGQEIEIIQKWTQTGNYIYLEVGITLAADSDLTPEEIMMYEAMTGTQEVKMQSALSHTEAMAIMNEPMNDADFNPQEMLMSLCMVETLGTFTPLPDEDGLTLYEVSMDTGDGAPRAEQVLKMWDVNNDDSLSWEEFNADVCGETPFSDDEAAEMEVFFNNADTNNDAGLTLDELDAFIADVDAHASDDDDHDRDHDDHGDHDDHSDHDGHDHDSDDPMMVCYDMNTHEVDMSIESESDCEAAGLMWTEMRDDDGDHHEDRDDREEEIMTFDFAFNNQGDVEFFRMDMGEDGGLMTIYILSDSRIESLTTSTNNGESVALPFTIEDDYYSDDDYMDDGGDEHDHDDTTHDEESWTFYREFAECDSDENMLINYGELQACVEMDLANDGSDMDVDDIGLRDIFDFANDDIDGDGNNLTEDEFDYIYLVLSGLSDDDHVDDELIFYDGCTESNDTADSPLECWMNDWLDSDGEIMMSDGYEIDDCTELSDNTGWECESRGDHSVEIPFICGDGTEIPFEDVNDGMNDCGDGADEQQYNETGEEINWFDCMDGSQVWITQVNDGVEDCADGDDEMPEMDEPHGDDHDDDFYCDDGSTIPMSWVNDGYADCADGEDEDDSDHDDGSDSGDAEFYITINDAMIPFEGDMNDYSIELASCEEDIDWDTGETIKDCTTQMTVSIADAMEIGSPVVFHDADSSGTISDGDMIHISALLVVDYDEVRLYSSSADAYSDENPVFEMPGFTGVVGVLALLGAALLRRKA